MKIIRDYYFKVPYGEPALTSGLPLPDPEKGPYKFIDCDFNFAVDKIMIKDYKDSEFVNCDRYPLT